MIIFYCFICYIEDFPKDKKVRDNKIQITLKSQMYFEKKRSNLKNIEKLLKGVQITLAIL